MKYLRNYKLFESNESIDLLKEKFIQIFNDLIDVSVDNIDKLSNEYNREDIYVFSTLYLYDDKYKDGMYEIYHLEANESTDVNKSDIIELGGDSIAEEFIKGNIVIDFALSHNNSFLPANYSEIINRMNRLYPDIEFDVMDPYSFEN